MLKLNIGCGRELKDNGWVNLDTWRKQSTIDWYETQRPRYITEKMSWTDKWCYENNSVDYITSEHMLEHIPKELGLYGLKEAFRVLKPNGILRIIVPSKDFYESLTDKSHMSNTFVAKYMREVMRKRVGFYDASFVRKRGLTGQGHVWVPDEKMLTDQIESAGFVDVNVVQYNTSKHEELNGIDLVDGLRELESIVCEGRKVI